jgi:hypothetical protein
MTACRHWLSQGVWGLVTGMAFAGTLGAVASMASVGKLGSPVPWLSRSRWSPSPTLASVWSLRTVTTLASAGHMEPAAALASVGLLARQDTGFRNSSGCAAYGFRIGSEPVSWMAFIAVLACKRNVVFVSITELLPAWLAYSLWAPRGSNGFRSGNGAVVMASVSTLGFFPSPGWLSFLL